MSTKIFNAIQIHKRSVLGYTKLMKDLSDEAKVLYREQCLTLARNVLGEKINDLVQISPYNTASVKYSVADAIQMFFGAYTGNISMFLASNIKDAIVEYMEKDNVTAAKELVQFLDVSASFIGGDLEFQLYEESSIPFAVMRWTTLPKSMERQMYRDYEDFCYQNQVDAPELNEQDSEFAAEITERLDYANLNEQQKARVMYAIAGAFYQKRDKQWMTLTGGNYEIHKAALCYPIMTIYEKLDMLNEVILEVYNERVNKEKEGVTYEN